MVEILNSTVSTDHAPAGRARSPQWHKVEMEQLTKFPTCLACGAAGPLQAHHIYAFHICVDLGRPDLELDLRNLITLCQTEAGRPAQDHHLLIGHLDDFESFNPDARSDAEATFHDMTAAQIRANPVWLAAKAAKPAHFGAMSDAEKTVLREELDRIYPLQKP